MINTTEIYNLIVIGIPETIAFTALAVILLRERIRAKIIFTTGFLTALAVLVFRLLDTGIHPAVAMIVMALLVAYFYRVPKLHALVACVFGFIILNVFELGTFFVLNQFYGLDIKDLAENKFLWVSSAWMKIALLALTALLITRTGWYRSRARHYPGHTVNRRGLNP